MSSSAVSEDTTHEIKQESNETQEFTIDTTPSVVDPKQIFEEEVLEESSCSTAKADPSNEKQDSSPKADPSTEKEEKGEERQKFDPHSFHPKHTVHFSTTPTILASIPPHSRLFVGNVDHLKKNDLAKIFVEFGNIVEISLKHRYGFVQFDHPEAVEKAIKATNNTEVQGKMIEAKCSKENKYSLKIRGQEPEKKRPREEEKPNRKRTKPMAEIEVLALGDVDSSFVRFVENTLIRANFEIHTTFLSPRANLNDTVNGLRRQGLRSVVFVEKSRERTDRVALQIFSPFSEYDNLTLDDTINILKGRPYQPSYNPMPPPTMNMPAMPPNLQPNVANLLSAVLQQAQATGQPIDPQVLLALTNALQNPNAAFNPLQAPAAPFQNQPFYKPF